MLATICAVSLVYVAIGFFFAGFFGVESIRDVIGATIVVAFWPVLVLLLLAFGAGRSAGRRVDEARAPHWTGRE